MMRDALMNHRDPKASATRMTQCADFVRTMAALDRIRDDWEALLAGDEPTA